MLKKKISQLDLANASLSGYLPMSDSAGTVTNKVTVQSILDLAGSSGGGSASFVASTVPSGFPASGVSNNLYIATDSSRLYRWDSSNGVYVELGSIPGGDSLLIPYFLPGSPSNISGVAGNSQVNLTWTASSTVTQIPVTDYKIQYSSNNGSSWTDYADSVSSSTSVSVTGLTNDMAYQFRVAGINGIGQGAWSTASDAVTPANTVMVQYLVVGGGGGAAGDRGGGGGAGGLRSDTGYTLTPGTSYTVTVGGGGAGSLHSAAPSSGADSAFSTITASGGGYGARGAAAAASGGCGGGGWAGSNTTGGSGNTPSTSPAQGNSGGNGSGGGPNYGAGGGGGASAAGSDGSTNAGGNGGTGTASSITGSSVTYAGGGGGGTFGGGATASSGGSGGGGSGSNGGNGTSGTASTGGGGGGGWFNDGTQYSGGSGGSGVVIIRASVAAASTTGSPTVTTVGNDTVYTFTGSGSITF